MTNYTFEFKPTEEIKDKFKLISVEAKDEKEAKKKLLKELTKVNSNIIDVIALDEYRYKRFKDIHWRALIEELQLIAEFYPTEHADAEAFVNKVSEIIEYLGEDIVYD